MKTTILWKSALVVSASLVLLFTILGEAAPMEEAGPQVATPPVRVTVRPLSDFLDAQGTQSMFFPPVKDYVGFTDHASVKRAINFALVDYAGLANDYLGGTLGTQVNGSVIQSALADGRAQITVNLFTTKALGFAQSVAALRNSDFDFLNTPTIFGNKAQDVANGAEAAVGESSLFVTFSISAPGAALPDLVDVLINERRKFRPSNVRFTATIRETCELGTRAVLHVDQAGPPGSGGPLSIVEIASEPCS